MSQQAALGQAPTPDNSRARAFCSVCDGVGTLSHLLPNGEPSGVIAACSACEGEGVVYAPRCSRCADTGWIEQGDGEPFRPCDPCRQRILRHARALAANPADRGALMGIAQDSGHPSLVGALPEPGRAYSVDPRHVDGWTAAGWQRRLTFALVLDAVIVVAFAAALVAIIVGIAHKYGIAHQ